MSPLLTIENSTKDSHNSENPDSSIISWCLYLRHLYSLLLLPQLPSLPVFPEVLFHPCHAQNTPRQTKIKTVHIISLALRTDIKSNTHTTNSIYINIRMHCKRLNNFKQEQDSIRPLDLYNNHPHQTQKQQVLKIKLKRKQQS